MRDIKPGKPVKRQLPPLNNEGFEELELYESSQESKKDLEKERREALKIKQKKDKVDRPIIGSSVPIASVEVDAKEIKKSDHRKTENGRRVKRPLFVQASLKRPGKVKVGRGERKVMLVFIVLVVVAASIATMIFLPTATIDLRLRTAPLLLDEEIVLGTRSDMTNFVPGTSFFREVTVNGSTQVKNMAVVGTKSKGLVEIVNKTIEQQKIKERSRLETSDGKLFYMMSHAIVPPNSRVTVEVEADKEGAEGNIEGQKLTFPALGEESASILYAEVKDKLTGGSGETVAVVSEEDIKNAEKEAQDDAKGQAKRQIEQELPEGWTMLEESWDLELSSFNANSEVGERIPVIDYEGRVKIRVMGFERQKFEEIMKEKLEQRLDEDYMLFPGPISYTQSVKKVDWEDAQAIIGVRVTHTTVPQISIDTLREKLAGRSEDEAKEYLEGLPGVRSAAMRLWPFWVRSVPRIEQRIDISFESEKRV